MQIVTPGSKTAIPTLLLCLFGLSCSVVTEPALGDYSNNGQSSGTRGVDTFEEAYSLYRNKRYDDAQDTLRKILSSVDSADALALQVTIQSSLAAKDNLKKAQGNDPRSLVDIV